MGASHAWQSSCANGKSRETFFFIFKAKKVPKMGFFVAGDPKNIILKIKKKISKLFKLFRTSISTGNFEIQKYVGNETP